MRAFMIPGVLYCSMKEDIHPVEGDTLKLTDIVHERAILGTGLPCGYKLADCDQTFDEYLVEVTNINTHEIRGKISSETLTLLTEDGDTVKVTYRGREPIAGTPGGSLRASNSQGASQGYVWEKVGAFILTDE